MFNVLLPVPKEKGSCCSPFSFLSKIPQARRLGDNFLVGVGGEVVVDDDNSLVRLMLNKVVDVLYGCLAIPIVTGQVDTGIVSAYTNVISVSHSKFIEQHYLSSSLLR